MSSVQLAATSHARSQPPQPDLITIAYRPTTSLSPSPVYDLLSRRTDTTLLFHLSVAWMRHSTDRPAGRPSVVLFARVGCLCVVPRRPPPPRSSPSFLYIIHSYLSYSYVAAVVAHRGRDARVYTCTRLRDNVSCTCVSRYKSRWLSGFPFFIENYTTTYTNMRQWRNFLYLYSPIISR